METWDSSSDFATVVREAGTHNCCAGYVFMRVASDSATLIKANVCQLSVRLSVQHIGVEKCQPNYLAVPEQVPLPVTSMIQNIVIAGMREWNVLLNQNV